MTKYSWKPLDVVVLGGGLAGLSCGLSMRRSGHKVRIYERYDFNGEVGASLSCASNGGVWLNEWDVDVDKAKPVILKDLIRRNWSTGEIESIYPLGDYREKYGFPYYNFHRIDIHQLLKLTCTAEEGQGTPCELILNHKAIKIDYETGTIEFENGEITNADLIIAADGIRSLTKPQLGVEPIFKSSDSSCIRILFNTSKVKELGLTDFSNNQAIEYWGGDSKFKIVLSPCSDNEVISCYCFYKAKSIDIKNDWNNDASIDQLLENVPNLDPQLIELFTKCGYDIKQWRLYVHEPIPHFYKCSKDNSKGVVLAGDSAHAMMPDQSQGAVAAFEDAGALGYIFSKKFNNLSIDQCLNFYEMARKPRVTKIQAASLRARENLNERIGWSSNDKIELKDKLTIDEVCGYDMKSHIDKLVKENCS